MDAYPDSSRSQGDAPILGWLFRKVAKVAENAACPMAATLRRGRPSSGGPHAVPDRGRPPDVGSGGHDDSDSTPVRRLTGGRDHPGPERHSSGTRVRGPETPLRGRALRGPRVLCLCGRARSGPHPGVHQKPRARRSAPGPNEPMALTGHRAVALKEPGPRARPPLAALRLTHESPRPCRGYLHQSRPTPGRCRGVGRAGHGRTWKCGFTLFTGRALIQSHELPRYIVPPTMVGLTIPKRPPIWRWPRTCPVLGFRA